MKPRSASAKSAVSSNGSDFRCSVCAASITAVGGLCSMWQILPQTAIVGRMIAPMNVLPGVTRDNIGNEVLAGITLLAIALPLNIGYAQIAGLPPTAGLYALVLPSVVFALMASSRHLVAAPDAAAAALVGSALSGLAPAGSGQYAAMAAAQAIVGGLLFLGCATFRLGFLADFLSKPILIGFVGGLATDILLSQIAKIMGIKTPSGAEFFTRLVHLVTKVGTLHVWSLLLGVAAVAVLVPARRRWPAVPWALVVLVLATVASTLLDLPGKGVAVLGSVPAGPPVFAVPQLSWSQWVAVVLPAMAITTVTVGEGLLLARSYADKYGYRTEPNRDLLAFGRPTSPPGCPPDSPSDPRPRGRRRWTRPDPAPSCRYW